MVAVLAAAAVLGQVIVLVFSGGFWAEGPPPAVAWKELARTCNAAGKAQFADAAVAATEHTSWLTGRRSTVTISQPGGSTQLRLDYSRGGFDAQLRPARPADSAALAAAGCWPGIAWGWNDHLPR